MANNVVFFSSNFFLRLLIMAFLWVSSDYYGLNAKHLNHHGPIHHRHHDDGSLVPSRPCKRPHISPERNPWRGGPSLIVMNRWCGVKKKNIPSEAQLIKWGAERVKSIHARLAAKEEVQPYPIQMKAYPGPQFNSASFVVQVELGSQQQHLIFDTGSDITWVQCNTCKKCFNQTDPLYDPSKSTTVTCESRDCKRLPHAEHTCGSDKDKSSKCQFKIKYADNTIIFGNFRKGNLTLSNKLVKDDYIFGCATDFEFQKVKLGGSSGIIGLNNNTESIIRQAGHEFDNIFSYCLPTGEENIGHLTFGDGRLKSSHRIPVKLSKKAGLMSEYMVELEDIMVSGRKLGIEKEVFEATEGTLIDSGSPVTYLAPGAYDKLVAAFTEAMMGYNESRVTNRTHGFEACYNLAGYVDPDHIQMPKISFVFSGGASIELSDKGTMYGGMEKRCLMFLKNEKPEEASIIGSHAQQTFDIIYNLKQNEIQFGPNGCH